MNEQNDHIWMHKKPETVFDWLAIIAISIALYLMLGHLNVFAGGIAKFVVPLCRTPMIYDGDLLLKGLAALYHDNHRD